MGQKQKKGEDRMSNRTRQNNKIADRKMDSNDSPEITDREETSEEPGLLSGAEVGVQGKMDPLPREVVVAEVQALEPRQQRDLLGQLGHLVVTQIQEGDVAQMLQVLSCDAHDGIVAQVKLLKQNAGELFCIFCTLCCPNGNFSHGKFGSHS